MHVSIVGVVQGVGFRPFVFRLAEELDLSGWVRNDESGVTIEVEGTSQTLARFLARLQEEKPPPAILYTVDHRFLPPRDRSGRSGFRIRQSTRSGKPRVWLLPDLGICADCRRELLDPEDRRYRYPFINCTHCGPRFTIIKGLPYDRPLTSMRRFQMCERCLAEYQDPQDRRFHAQPNGHLNSAFALSRGREIIVSQYLGDLDAYESRLLFQRTVEDFLSLYDIRPQVVVHDLHPDYFTTHLARQLAEKWNIPSAAESSATATSPRASSPPWNPTPAPPSSTPNSPPTDGNLSIGQLWSAARNRASQS